MAVVEESWGSELSPPTMEDGWRPAPPGGMPYDPPNCTGITVKGVPCSAPRAKGTLFCIGHLRSEERNDR